MRKLVHQNETAIEKLQQTANETATMCNHLLEKFKTGFNYFSQPITADTAFELLSEPIGFFDRLLLANSPVKQVAGLQQDITKLAQLVGADRDGFIRLFTVILPGSKDQYNKQGSTALFQLTSKYRPFLNWSNECFVLNQKELDQLSEKFRVYAETKEQLEALEKWETLCTVLNGHKDFVNLDTIDSNRIAHMLHVEFINNLFVPKYEALAVQIKSMVLAN